MVEGHVVDFVLFHCGASAVPAAGIRNVRILRGREPDERTQSKPGSWHEIDACLKIQDFEPAVVAGHDSGSHPHSIEADDRGAPGHGDVKPFVAETASK